MKRIAILLLLPGVLWLAGPRPANAGEPLVIKTAEGRFVPAAAREWAPAGKDAFRFVLKPGLAAPQVAAELEERIAPIQVEAADELTLVFRGPGLDQAALLAKLADLPLGGDRAMGDALAALGDLGSAAAPSMGDVSSAGSIRAAKVIELPGDEARRTDPARLVAKVVGIEPCQPVPLLHLEVLEPPRAGDHKDSFHKGQAIVARGYYAFRHGTRQVDGDDPRTRINLRSNQIKLGTKVFGKPFQKDGEEWVFETIEPL